MGHHVCALPRNYSGGCPSWGRRKIRGGRQSIICLAVGRAGTSVTNQIGPLGSFWGGTTRGRSGSGSSSQTRGRWRVQARRHRAGSSGRSAGEAFAHIMTDALPVPVPDCTGTAQRATTRTIETCRSINQCRSVSPNKAFWVGLISLADRGPRATAASTGWLSRHGPTRQRAPASTAHRGTRPIVAMDHYPGQVRPRLNGSSPAAGFERKA